MKSKKNSASKRLILPVLLITILLSITMYASSKAQNNLSILRWVEENIPGVDISKSNQKISDQEPVKANEVILLIDKMKLKKVKDDSWVHIIANVVSEEDNGVILPDGSPMPASYVQDDWCYINKDGLIEKGVFTMKDLSGDVFQQSAFQNNIMLNLTFDMRQENQQPYPLNIDFGFANQVKDAEKMGLAIKKSEEKKGDKASIVFTYVETLKTPTQMGNESAKINSITVKGYFDKASEDFWQTQTVWALDNGKEVIFESTQLISIDSVSKAPDEILAILDGVK